MQIASHSKEAFLESLAHQTAQRAEIDVQEMLKAFDSVPMESFKVAELNNVVSFSIEQLALWRAKWLFSSVAAPNVQARDQSARWEATTEAFIKCLADLAPAVGDPLKEKRDTVIIQYLLKEKLRRDGDNKLLSFRAWSLSKLAQITYRIGLSNLARGLQARALFPPGTMGRAGA